VTVIATARKPLSEEQIEYQVRDRLSFTRFLGLGLEDAIPDGTTLWVFREKLAQAGLVERTGRDVVRAVRPASEREGVLASRRRESVVLCER
jgi:hypothetical protein